MRLRRYGWKILSAVDGVMSSAGWEYYCEYGTLLGLMREGGFIRHDDDIDFGLPPDRGITGEIFLALRRKGFQFNRAFVWQGQVTEIAFSYNGVTVDFFYTFCADDMTFGQLYNNFIFIDGKQYAEKVTRLVKPPFCGTKPFIVRGVRTRLPINAESLLVSNYGNSWRMPMRNFKADGDVMNRKCFPDKAEIILDEGEMRQILGL